MRRKAIDARVYRMVTRRGFIDLFWLTLTERRRQDPAITHEQVYHELNELYLQEFGEPRYRSFDAFRKDRDRHG